MLYTIISRFVFSGFYVLLSNAKPFENGMEDFIGGDGAASDFGKVEKHGAEVLAKCLRWEFIEPTFNHSIKL